MHWEVNFEDLFVRYKVVISVNKLYISRINFSLDLVTVSRLAQKFTCTAENITKESGSILIVEYERKRMLATGFACN